MANFGNFLRPAFPASHVQHVSDLHPIFALRPRHVWKYGRHPISVRKKKKNKRQDENIYGMPYYIGRP